MHASIFFFGFWNTCIYTRTSYKHTNTCIYACLGIVQAHLSQRYTVSCCLVSLETLHMFTWLMLIFNMNVQFLGVIGCLFLWPCMFFFCLALTLSEEHCCSSDLDSVTTVGQTSIKESELPVHCVTVNKWVHISLSTLGCFFYFFLATAF